MQEPTADNFSLAGYRYLCLFILSYMGRDDNKAQRIYFDDTVRIYQKGVLGGLEVRRVAHTDLAVGEAALVFCGSDQNNQLAYHFGEHFDPIKGHIVALARRAMGPWPSV